MKKHKVKLTLNLWVIIETTPFRGEFDRYPDYKNTCPRTKLVGDNFYITQHQAKGDLKDFTERFPDLDFKVAPMNLAHLFQGNE